MNDTPILSSRFEEALVLAARLHRGHMRKGGSVPYISHLMQVAGLVLEFGGDEEEAIAALLHDAIEDQGGAATGELIREQFGERVRAIVEGCSDTDQTPKPPWRARKEAHLAHLRSASPSVRLVVAADKLHSARTLLTDYRQHGEALWSRFKGGKEGTLWYHREALTVLQAHGKSPIVEELAHAVGELERRVGTLER
jgi:GTP pyrophosphokinase